jgi:hypothetical protein
MTDQRDAGALALGVTGLAAIRFHGGLASVRLRAGDEPV